jgi:hypothetical protein
MSLEKRGNGEYFYLVRRVGGRVVKQYVGGGAAGALAAHLDAIRQEMRRTDRERAKIDRERLAALAAPVDALDAYANKLVAAVLHAAGYHRPKRAPWRKRRA